MIPQSKNSKECLFLTYDEVDELRRGELKQGVAQLDGGRAEPHGAEGADLCSQMAKFDPFLSLDCARVEGVGVQSKERKGSNFAA